MNWLYTDIEYMELLGERAKAHRLKVNITQKEMGEHIGVTTKTISLFENGKGVHLLYFIRILRQLNLDYVLTDILPDIEKEVDPYEKVKTKKQRAS